MIMDATEYTMDGKLRKILEAEGVGLIKCSHRSWGASPPQHILYITNLFNLEHGKCSPPKNISGVVEVTTLCMLPFINIPGDHRA